MADEEPQQPHGLREMTATAIAAVIIIGFVVLVAASTQAAGNSGEFTAMKDLLTFVNPLAGVVVGFYFTKAAVEPRAERAEAAAKTALNEASVAQHSAEEAQHARTTAEIGAERARHRAENAIAAVETVTEAADRVLRASATAGPPVLSGSGTPTAKPELDALRDAVAMARRLISDGGGN